MSAAPPKECKPETAEFIARIAPDATGHKRYIQLDTFRFRIQVHFLAIFTRFNRQNISMSEQAAYEQALRNSLETAVEEENIRRLRQEQEGAATNLREYRIADSPLLRADRVRYTNGHMFASVFRVQSTRVSCGFAAHPIPTRSSGKFGAETQHVHGPPHAVRMGHATAHASDQVRPGSPHQENVIFWPDAEFRKFF